jgi:hypothetical protein
MRPEIGKTYSIRIPRRQGYEYLDHAYGEQRTIAECIGGPTPDRLNWKFATHLPHEHDEGRGVGFRVNEEDILSEA